MENCLTSKLIATVDNDSILKLSEFRVYSDSATTQFTIRIGGTGPLTLNVLGGKLFTDSGRTNEITGDYTFNSGDKTFYATNNNKDFKLSILGKENLSLMICNYVHATLEQLQFCPDLDTISAIFENEDRIYFGKYNGNFSNLYINGDKWYGTLNTDSINTIARAGFLYITTSNFGDLRAIADAPEIRLGTFSHVVNTDIDYLLAFANIESLKRFVMAGTSKPQTWPSTTLRDTNLSPFSIWSPFASSTDVDNYLINMAACEGTTYPSDKEIKSSTKRTSASDSAVSTLTSRGFTVNISK